MIVAAWRQCMLPLRVQERDAVRAVTCRYGLGLPLKSESVYYLCLGEARPNTGPSLVTGLFCFVGCGLIWLSPHLCPVAGPAAGLFRFQQEESLRCTSSAGWRFRERSQLCTCRPCVSCASSWSTGWGARRSNCSVSRPIRFPAASPLRRLTRGAPFGVARVASRTG